MLLGLQRPWLAPARHQKRLHKLLPPNVACHGHLDDAEAYAEAYTLYESAVKLSTLQTQAEMEVQFQSEAPEASDDAERGAPPTEAAVTALLQEFGLSAREASCLYRDLVKAAAARGSAAAAASGSSDSSSTAAGNASAAPPPVMPLSQLASRLVRWQRVLPGLNPASLAVRDVQLLYADVSQGLRALILLVSTMPGRDVMGMLQRLPRLLWIERLQERLQGAVAQLVRLHPSADQDIVLDMIAENPELILRMEYYTTARLIDDLPIEIQNMMVVADQGIGYTYRYYRNRRTNYKAELTSNEPFEQQT